MRTTQRVAKPQEIDAVAALAHEIWNQHFPTIIGQEQVDYMLAKFQSGPAIARQIREEGYEYYLIVDEGDRVGYVALVPDEDRGAMQLSKLYLRRSSRGRGVGRAVVAFIENECAARGLEELWLTVNKDNRGSIVFYERVGFVIAGSTVTDIGEGFVMDDYRMTKTVR